MDFFKSSVERLLCNKNQEGLNRELTVTKEQAERIYSAYSCSFPVTGETKDIYTKHKEETQMKRKVREDFNPEKEYSVNVKGCSEEERKEVQQAFFDVGILWKHSGAEYRYQCAVQYSNTTCFGEVTTYLMHGSTTGDCNMTAEQFLNLVYEDDMEEKKGHVHAELMLQYAEDAKTHAEPWKLWQFHAGGVWLKLYYHPTWEPSHGYRRKHKTHTVNGVEIPDLRVTPEYGEDYYIANPLSAKLVTHHRHVEHTSDKLWVGRGLSYQFSEEGEQAAIMHSKAMLGIKS